MILEGKTTPTFCTSAAFTTGIEIIATANVAAFKKVFILFCSIEKINYKLKKQAFQALKK
ncbi:hypothetical protein GCM10007916_04630 [Psychromonas marina]|uniref:Uncharacterized protein n=1 Tax=Psychromonas marina TaxID=88364 RepID=A0ABQ6DW82_9GAMM|nr:hypothetical protein GCM10007916_04630 [Psychromonas marina]